MHPLLLTPRLTSEMAIIISLSLPTVLAEVKECYKAPVQTNNTCCDLIHVCSPQSTSAEVFQDGGGLWKDALNRRQPPVYKIEADEEVP